MKKIILLFILFLAANSVAQTNGITYQAVILNPSVGPSSENNLNTPLADKEICMSFKFFDEYSKLEYQEVIQTKTDAFGMVNLIIGTGSQTDGYATSFEKILWDSLKKSLVVAINTNGSCASFTEISNQPFTYVPFAFSSINATNVTGVVSIENGGTNATTILDAKKNLGIENIDNISDLNKPLSLAELNALGLKENSSNKSSDVILDGDSAVKYPSVKSVKSYVDATMSTANVALASEISRAKAADATLSSDLATETTRATTAEGALATNLASETTARISAGTVLTSDLATEATRATTTEGALATDLASETTARTNADTTLTSDLATESTRATAAEGALATDLASETTARINADTTLISDLAVETTNRTSADDTLTTNVALEVTRAIAAETTIVGNASSEASTRASADEALIADLVLKAALDSPIFAGTPTTPTAIAGTNTTQIATTAYVLSAISTAVIEVADEFTASAAQVNFILTQTPSTNSKVKMYVNGIRVSNTSYSWDGKTLIYSPTNNGEYELSVNDRIQFDYYTNEIVMSIPG